MGKKKEQSKPLPAVKIVVEGLQQFDCAHISQSGKHAWRKNKKAMKRKSHIKKKEIIQNAGS